MSQVQCCTAALIQALAWAFPYATGMALERKRGEKKNQNKVWSQLYWYLGFSGEEVKNPYYVPDTVPISLLKWIHLTLMPYHFHFIG